VTTVAVCIPSIPPRREYLRLAVCSALNQSRQPNEVSVVVDHVGVGAASNRNVAWRNTTSEWIAFLDDDDVMYPQHIETLLEHSEGADLVYPWFDLPTGEDPLRVLRNGELVNPLGVPFGEEQAAYVRDHGNFIPVTVLVRRELLAEIDGFPQPGSARWGHETCEDWGCWQDLLRAGARFRHAPFRTWEWRWHGLNTSGRPWRG